MNLKEKPFNLNDEQIKWVMDTVSSMTDDEKAEQLFFPLILNFDENYLKAIAAEHCYGGFMFRPDTAVNIQRATSILRQNSRIPVFLSANLEDGGNGIAFEGTSIGRQMLIAATNDPTQAYHLGRVCGSEGKAVGLNMSFSPVVDIDKNYHNPITNVRTYGSDVDCVIKMGRECLRGLCEEGIIPTIKHFPGDGVDERDQHLATTVNSLDLEEWENSYGKVYRTLLGEGAPVVMTGHIAMPAIEEYYEHSPCTRVIPASSSRNVLRYLRKELGFEGLVITDASPMVGYMSNNNRETAVPLSIENGCDMFLFNFNLEEDVRFMKQGIKNGILSRERLDEALTRILALKARQGLDKSKSGGTIISGSDALSAVGSEEHIAWARECADKGVTLVKDTRNVLPVTPEKYPNILLEILGDFSSNDRVYAQFESTFKSAGFNVTKYVPETLENIFDNDGVSAFKARYDLVVYIGNIENASNKTTARINWHTLFGAGNNLPWFAREVPTLFISVGNPYHLLDAPMVGAYVNAYVNSPAAIDAAIQKVMGRSQFKGTSPVDPFCGKWDTRL